VVDKLGYIRLPSAASVDNTSKFTHVDDKRGRPPKHFHPLLQKEKELHEILQQILPEEIANSLSLRVPGSLIFMAYPRLIKGH